MIPLPDYICRLDEGLLQVLTAVERMEAMSRFRSHAPGLERWIGLLLFILLLVSVVILAGLSYNRIQHARMAAAQAFLENARRRSLSTQEYQLLLQIARKAGLSQQQVNMIFASPGHFDRGFKRLTADVLNKQGPQAYDRIMADAAFLREKLGFNDPQATQWLTRSTGITRFTTRDIPVGKTLFITRRLSNRSDQITAKLIGNDPKQLTVEIAHPIRITFGELWRARYLHGASVWEFDTAVLSFEGTKLVLRHSPDVRFLNRRRFVRQAIQADALLAKLPFCQQISDHISGLDIADLGANLVRAKLTELAGPGLRIISPMPVQPTDRLLVLFELARANQRYLVSDIAIVRRIEASPQGYIIGVELIGHKDTDLEDLLRISRDLAGQSNVSNPQAQDMSDQDSVVEYMVQETGENG